MKMLTCFQPPNNEFDFSEVFSSPYVQMNSEGVVRTKADLTNAPDTFTVSVLCTYLLGSFNVELLSGE